MSGLAKILKEAGNSAILKKDNFLKTSSFFISSFTYIMGSSIIDRK